MTIALLGSSRTNWNTQAVMRRQTQSRSRESCCQTFFPMTLAALHLFLTMAGHSATMLSTSSSPFTQMGRWQEMVSDRMAICSTTSRTSGRHTNGDAPPLSASRNRIGVTDQVVPARRHV